MERKKGEDSVVVGKIDPQRKIGVIDEKGANLDQDLINAARERIQRAKIIEAPAPSLLNPLDFEVPFTQYFSAYPHLRPGLNFIVKEITLIAKVSNELIKKKNEISRGVLSFEQQQKLQVVRDILGEDFIDSYLEHSEALREKLYKLVMNLCKPLQVTPEGIIGGPAYLVDGVYNEEGIFENFIQDFELIVKEMITANEHLDPFLAMLDDGYAEFDPEIDDHKNRRKQDIRNWINEQGYDGLFAEQEADYIIDNQRKDELFAKLTGDQVDIEGIYKKLVELLRSIIRHENSSIAVPIIQEIQEDEYEKRRIDIFIENGDAEPWKKFELLLVMLRYCLRSLNLHQTVGVLLKG